MDVVADFPADAQAAEPVQEGEALLNDPSVHAQAGAVLPPAWKVARRNRLVAAAETTSSCQPR